VSADTTYYELLGVEPDAPKDEIRTAYQAKLADVRAHRTREEETRRPSDDVIRAKREEEAQLRTAWQILSDPVQRERYDERIHVDGAGEVDAGAETAEAEPEDEEEEEGTDAELVPAAPSRPAGRPVSERTLEIPSNGRRMTAAIIDGITFAALWTLIALPLVYGAGLTKGSPPNIIVYGTSTFLVVVYFIVPIYRSGQTLGKRYTYTMVVDRGTGLRPKVGQVINRYLVPAFLVPLAFPTGALLAAFLGLSFLMSRDQISLLDRLARTVDVIARYKPERLG
jgi:uncharacterized RDD family membrane protein YckC